MTHVLVEVGKSLNNVMEKISSLAKNTTMKKAIMYLTVVFLGIALLQNNGCKPKPTNPQFPAYSSNDLIVNPPDIFQIIYDISYNGNRLANVTFEEDAVWRIEKLGDVRIYFWANNDTTSHVIEKIDTLGLKGGHNYIFGANNNNYNEFNSLFTQFDKLEIDYETYEKKF